MILMMATESTLKKFSTLSQRQWLDLQPRGHIPSRSEKGFDKGEEDNNDEDDEEEENKGQNVFSI